jgi:AraC-like DNA-binding protein
VEPIDVSLWSSRRLAYGVLPLLSALEAHGVNPTPILKRAEIDVFGLYDPGYTIAIEQELRLLKESFAAVAEPAFGLEVAARYDLRSFSTLGLAMQASQDLAQVLTLVAEFPQLAWGVSKVMVTLQPPYVELGFEPHPLLGVLTQDLVERDMLCALRVLSQCLGEPIEPSQVWLQRKAPSASLTERYASAFVQPPQWSQHGHRMAFKMHILSQPLAQADPRIQRFYRAQCQQMVAELSTPFRLTQAVRERLRQTTPMPDLSQLAAQMWLSPRTLQRRLAKEHSCFSRLLQEVRLERACARLQEGQVALQTLAAELGFADVVAFTHAFCGWTGEAPGRWQAAQAR